MALQRPMEKAAALKLRLLASRRFPQASLVTSGLQELEVTGNAQADFKQLVVGASSAMFAQNAICTLDNFGQICREAR